MESLEKHVRTLSDILEKEYKLYKQIFDLIKKEQSVLVSADIEKLEKNLYQQQQLTVEINKLEVKRLEELEVIGIYLGMLPERIKLAEIARHVDKDIAENLLKHEKLFKTVLQGILKLNKNNKFLIDRSLQFIEKNVQAFFGALEEKGLYNVKTSRQNAMPRTRRLVDWKA